MKSTKSVLTITTVAAAILLSRVSAFTIPHSTTVFPTSVAQPTSEQKSSTRFIRLSPLFGRAAAVRAFTKGKTDAKKAKVNGYYGKKIMMCVKQGGSPDPVANRQLGDLIKAAKNNSVPIDNINRAIKRATEKGSGDFAESIYEAYGHGGASLIINVLSDNPNRSISDVKSTVQKNNGKIAESGSVLFMYDFKGKVEIPAEVDEEELMMAAIDAGVDDMELVEGDEEGTSIVYTDPKETSMMFEAVKSIGLEEGSKMSLLHVSKAPMECSEEDFENNMKIIEKLLELDDVDSVEHNMSN